MLAAVSTPLQQKSARAFPSPGHWAGARRRLSARHLSSNFYAIYSGHSISSRVVLATSQGQEMSDLASGQAPAWDPEGLLGEVDASQTKHFDRRAENRRAFAEVPTVVPEEQGFGAEVEAAFVDVFRGAHAAPRVLDSFRRLRAGDEYVHVWPGKGVQRAGSFMEGLSAEPFPDLHNGQYGWLEHVEEHAQVIQKEFSMAMEDPGSMLVRGNRIWSKAARDEAVAYGPNWRTLVLQDRGIWDESNIKLFPKTYKMLASDIHAPTLEVFFAKQDGKTGIASHTDNSNFIQTTHLGVDVPEGECWIKVGDHTREWKNGKIIICDTSFMHETQNNSEKDRYVLIMRHWHPEVTPIERIANEFLFAALDSGDSAGVAAAQKVAAKKIKGLVGISSSSKKGSKSGGGFGGGFGKRGKK